MFNAWWPTLMDLLQVALLTTCIYYAFIVLKGTRAAQILLGVGAVFLAIFLVTSLLDLDVVNVVLRWVTVVLLLALLVVFQPELRRMLSLLGRNASVQLLQGKLPDTPAELLVRVARSLAMRHLGALLVVERAVALDRWCETGAKLDALVGEELLISIFTPPLPLHDGAVILRGDRIRAARCILPIDNELKLEGMGTRHRAALSLSAECDALILVVSEERGQISVARDGNMFKNLTDRQLVRLLRAAFVPPEGQTDFFHAVFGPRHQVPWFLKPFVRLSEQRPSARKAPDRKEPEDHA